MKRFGILALLLVRTLCSVQEIDTEVKLSCPELVDAFLDARFPNLLENRSHEIQEYNPDDFIFFLHVPRTAGRSFWSCFLSKAFPPSKKCVKSYDSLRLELSRPDCKLISSHDDYSITDYLPDGFRVITQARDPVDRVISAYEFTALIAARDYHPNVTQATNETDKVKTRDVWPWLYLGQLFDRYIERTVGHHFKKAQKIKDADPKGYEASLDKWVQSVSPKSGKTYYYHRRTRQSKWTLEEEEKKDLLPVLDPYNNSLILPLHLFVDFPMVEDLINNAMTYQVLGLTNISYWEEAAEIRQCSIYSKKAQEKLLEAAKAQMDNMLHISLTDRLDESLRSIAGTMKLKLTGHTWIGQPAVLQGANTMDKDLSLDHFRDDLSNIDDEQLLKLLFKYRYKLDEIRIVARSRKRSQLTKKAFLPKWDTAVAAFQDLRKIQMEVLMRRKLKGDAFTEYPAKPDDRKTKQKVPLWRAYKKCVNTTITKTYHSKIRSMNNLALPDERRPYFTKQARQSISESTIHLIKEKNWMDVHLYEYAVKLYEAYLTYQSENGLLEDIPGIHKNKNRFIEISDPSGAVDSESVDFKAINNCL